MAHLLRLFRAAPDVSRQLLHNRLEIEENGWMGGWDTGVRVKLGCCWDASTNLGFRKLLRLLSWTNETILDVLWGGMLI